MTAAVRRDPPGPPPHDRRNHRRAQGRFEGLDGYRADRLEFEDGTTLPLRGSYQDPHKPGITDHRTAGGYRFTEAIPQIDRNIAVFRLPTALETLASGGTLEFDDIVLSGTEIRYKRKVAAWSSVGAAEIKNGYLSFPYRETRKGRQAETGRDRPEPASAVGLERSATRVGRHPFRDWSRPVSRRW